MQLKFEKKDFLVLGSERCGCEGAEEAPERSDFALMSRARVKKASSTLMFALAEVSRNFVPYSMASC